MSRASEWAETVDFRGEPYPVATLAEGFVFDGSTGTALVIALPEHGAALTILGVAGKRPTFKADEALALARLILDVFGDEAKP